MAGQAEVWGYICGRGSARGRILYPGAVAGAQPKPGPCAVVVVGEGGSAALKRASVARYRYKSSTKMIFVRPGRKRGADTMSRPCEKVVSRTLKSVPNHKTTHFPTNGAKCPHRRGFRDLFLVSRATCF